VIESLSVVPVEKRFEKSLLEKFNQAFEKVSGKKGGFLDKKTEYQYQERGKEMLKKVEANPGPLKKLAIKIKMDLPYYWLSEEDNIILCGLIDWIEYLKDEDKVHIIDFKTGKKKENKDSLQLPIYYLLASNTQKREVKKMSYWYIDQSSEPVEQKLPDEKEAVNKVLKIAKEIKLARQLNRFKCPHGGCKFCEPFEKILRGEAEKVGNDDIGREVYILPDQETATEEEIL